MWLVDSSACTSDQEQPVHTSSQVTIRSGIKRKRKCSDPCDSDSIKLTIIAIESLSFDSHWN